MGRTSNRGVGRKHIPQRTCIGCRQVRNNRELVRIVRTPDGRVEIDGTHKKPGRGAYVCPSASCWEKALNKGTLVRALKTTLTPEQLEELRTFVETLPAENVETEA